MRENTAQKLQKIQSLFDMGKSHAEIAKALGYTNIKSYYRYIYEYGEHLNYAKQYDKKGMHVVENNETPHIEGKVTDKEVEAVSAPKENLSKAETVVQMLERGLDIREVAKKKRFKETQDLANYMSGKGYKWDNEKKNYVLSTTPLEDKVQQDKKDMEYVRDVMNDEDSSNGIIEKYGDILRLINDNKDKLDELLSGDPQNKGNPPWYNIRGMTVGKTYNIAIPLIELIKDYSEEYDLSQKDIIKVAVIEFLMKYGYREEVKRKLNI